MVLAKGQLILSPALVAELADVLTRSKFDQYLTIQERDEFLTAVVKRGELAEDVEVIDACRDASDNRLLEAAIAGNAEFLLTGDGDLLALDPFRGVWILKPGDFVRLIDPTPPPQSGA